MTELASGWAEATVGDLADYVNGHAFKPRDWGTEGLPIIRIQNLTGSSLDFNRTTKQVGPRYLVAPGDILVSWSATLDAFVWAGPEALLNQHIFKVVPNEALVDRRLLFWGLKQVIGEMWRSEHTHGSTMKHINRGPFLVHQFSLPPLNEQRRIVAKIEALTARSRRAREALEQVPPLLERFRQSVLAAAFRGDLTADWRRQNPDVEPASALLERLRAERRRRWEEAQLAKFRAKGKEPKKGWQSRYPKPRDFDETDLPEAPSSWSLASVDELSCLITSGSRAWTPHYGRGTGTFLMAQNVRPKCLDLTFRQAVDPPVGDADRARSQVEEDDVLVTIVGANTGDVCRVPKPLPEHYVCQSVALVRPVLGQLSPYLECYLAAERAGGQQFRRYMYGQGRPHLSFDQLRMTVVPIPPLLEQAAILERLEGELSGVRACEAAVLESHGRLDRLDQAILAKAFRGELVPQDSNDEPASVLLERIRAERAAAGPTPRTRGRKRKALAAPPAAAAPPHPTPAERNGDGQATGLGALIEPLKRAALHRVADALEVPLPDRRARAAAREALVASGLRAETLLEPLLREDLQTICRALDLPARGRTKRELIARIVEATS